MFSPVAEAETRQKLLRNVKKEVGAFYFICAHHILCLRALYAQCVCVCVVIVHQG